MITQHQKSLKWLEIEIHVLKLSISADFKLNCVKIDECMIQLNGTATYNTDM